MANFTTGTLGLLTNIKSKLSGGKGGSSVIDKPEFVERRTNELKQPKVSETKKASSSRPMNSIAPQKAPSPQSKTSSVVSEPEFSILSTGVKSETPEQKMTMQVPPSSPTAMASSEFDDLMSSMDDKAGRADVVDDSTREKTPNEKLEDAPWWWRPMEAILSPATLLPSHPFIDEETGEYKIPFQDETVTSETDEGRVRPEYMTRYVPDADDSPLDALIGSVSHQLGWGSNAWNAAIDKFSGLRSDNADENAEWGYDVNGEVIPEDQYIEMGNDGELVEVGTGGDWNQWIALPNGGKYTESDYENATIGKVREAKDGEEADSYYSDGVPAVIETIKMGNGDEVSYDDYLNYTIEDEYVTDGSGRFNLVFTTPEGQKMTKAEFDSLEPEQTNTGFLNFNKSNPDQPWNNPADFVPWTTDAILSSLPYFSLWTGIPTAASRTVPGISGFDPNTYDPETATYEDTYVDNSQRLANTVLPASELLAEKIGGITPSGMFGKLSTEARTAPGKLAKTMAEEGFEETLTAPLEQISQSGLSNLGKNMAWNEEEQRWEYEDTPGNERAMNVGTGIFHNFMGGAIVGGVVGGANMAAGKIRAKGSGQPKSSTKGYSQINYDDIFATLTQEQLDRLDKLVMDSNRKGEE